MHEVTVRKYFIFVKHIFMEIYILRASSVELNKIVVKYIKAGFPVAAGCLAWIKIVWKNGPYAEKVRYHNRKASKMESMFCEA